MPNLLKDLRIGEVSSVDRGAGKGVRVMLMKRDGDAGLAMNIEIANAAIATVLKANAPLVLEVAKKTANDATASIDSYMKREFSDDKRKELAASGKAMPGGGYPIENVEDLHNAIRAIGRAKDPAATKKHIISRARALGQSAAIPDTWKGGKRATSTTPLAKFLSRVGFRKDGAMDFDDAQAAGEGEEYADACLEEFQEALCALHEAVCSILCDDDTPDKRAALEESFDQYKEHVQGVVPEGIEDAMNAAALIADGYAINSGGSISKGDDTMPTPAEIEKAVNEAVAKALAPVTAQLATLTKENKVLKMSDKHTAYMEHEDATMPKGGKDGFAEMTPEERDEHMGKHPIEKKADPIATAVAKAAAPLVAENEALKKRLDASDLATATASFAKRAADMGAPGEFGETIRKAFGGDKDSVEALVKKLEQVLKAQAAQDSTSALFGEIGKGGSGNGATAYEQLMVKAREYLDKNRGTDKKLTIQKAFGKVYEDPGNAELVTAYKRESAKAA